MTKFKRHQAILLPSLEEQSTGPIIKTIDNSILMFFKFPNMVRDNSNIIFNHLYVLSDVEPEIDDWVYSVGTKAICRLQEWFFKDFPSDKFKLVIASTDPILDDVPNIPSNFLTKYCKQGGGCEILIEYTTEGYRKFGIFTETFYNRPKIVGNEIIAKICKKRTGLNKRK